MTHDWFRAGLYAITILLGVWLWQAWQEEHPSESAKVSVAENPVTAASAQTVLPGAVSGGRLFHLHHERLDVMLREKDGSLLRAQLLQYPETLGKEKPVTLFSETADGKNSAQLGVRVLGDEKPSQENCRLAEDRARDASTLTLQCENKTGLQYTKTFRLLPHRYVVDVQVDVKNVNSSPMSVFFFEAFSKEIPAEQSAHSWLPGAVSFSGAAVSTSEKMLVKWPFSDFSRDADLSLRGEKGWVAMLQHYFVSAWVPSPEEKLHLYGQLDSLGVVHAGYTTEPKLLQPGNLLTKHAQLYVGPKVAADMRTVSASLPRTLDYGWLSFISEFLFLLLQYAYRFTHNWGVAIILLTVTVKLAFYQLSASSYRSMAKMKALAPKITLLRERYASDRAKLSQETMKLYRQAKVNPLGGCLPVLVQIPVFFALYWVLMESVELRQAPFFLWIHDLSARDAYMVLPILMGISMFVQQKMSAQSAAMDPTQARVMSMLPFIFTVLFLTFPSGLVLYWLVNNTLSIAQQWWITKQFSR